MYLSQTKKTPVQRFGVRIFILRMYNFGEYLIIFPMRQ